MGNNLIETQMMQIFTFYNKAKDWNTDNTDSIDCHRFSINKKIHFKSELSVYQLNYFAQLIYDYTTNHRTDQKPP